MVGDSDQMYNELFGGEEEETAAESTNKPVETTKIDETVKTEEEKTKNEEDDEDEEDEDEDDDIGFVVKGPAQQIATTTTAKPTDTLNTSTASVSSAQDTTTSTSAPTSVPTTAAAQPTATHISFGNTTADMLLLQQQHQANLTAQYQQHHQQLVQQQQQLMEEFENKNYIPLFANYPRGPKMNPQIYNDFLAIIAEDAEKPWKKPGANLDDYFNYGFTEATFILYCQKQLKIREEYDLPLPGTLGATKSRVVPRSSSTYNNNNSYNNYNSQQQQQQPQQQQDYDKYSSNAGNVDGSKGNVEEGGLVLTGPQQRSSTSVNAPSRTMSGSTTSSGTSSRYEDDPRRRGPSSNSMNRDANAGRDSKKRERPDDYSSSRSMSSSGSSGPRDPRDVRDPRGDSRDAYKSSSSRRPDPRYDGERDSKRQKK